MKTQIIRNLIIAGIVVFIIGGCCEGDSDIYFYLDEEHRLNYNEGDTLFYESNFGKIDTFIVIEFEEKMLSEETYDFCGTTEYYETLECRFKTVENDSVTNFIFCKTDHTGIEWNNTVFSLDEDSLQGVFINNLEYDNVSHFIRIEEYGGEIQDLYFKYPIGILQYNCENSEKWYIKK